MSWYTGISQLEIEKQAYAGSQPGQQDYWRQTTATSGHIQPLNNQKGNPDL